MNSFQWILFIVLHQINNPNLNDFIIFLILKKKGKKEEEKDRILVQKKSLRSKNSHFKLNLKTKKWYLSYI